MSFKILGRTGENKPKKKKKKKEKVLKNEFKPRQVMKTKYCCKINNCQVR